MPTDEAPLLRNFLRPCVLLLVREQPSHGYELLDRLVPLGLRGDDPGGLYRTLRTLESEGLLRSAWEPSTAGPDRRIYSLTRAGGEELHRASKAVAAAAETLGFFLSRYGEFVALSRDAPRDRPATETVRQGHAGARVSPPP